MERQLATVQRISEFRPIPGADKIQVALMEGLGWECVVKKEEFKIGDLVVYCEVDSVLPEKPEFEFLRERKFRIKIIKLKQQVSMGLILPLKCLPDYKKKNYKVGTDVTEILGITKYETPTEREESVQISKKHWTNKYKMTKWLWKYKWFRNLIIESKSKGFPKWISKTDELRGQSFNWPKFYDQYKDCEFYGSEKVDCQSASFTSSYRKRNGILGKIFKPKFEFIVCSRNHKTNDKSTLYWKIAEKYNIENILRENPDISIQGEQGDTKVQGNKYGIKEPKLWVFNVINHKTNYQYNYDEMCDFCGKYGLTPVDLVFKGKLSEIGSTVNDFIEFSKGKSLYANIPREGIVFRYVVDGKKIVSFKIINPDFLLEYKD